MSTAGFLKSLVSMENVDSRCFAHVAFEENNARKLAYAKTCTTVFAKRDESHDVDLEFGRGKYGKRSHKERTCLEGAYMFVLFSDSLTMRRL